MPNLSTVVQDRVVPRRLSPNNLDGDGSWRLVSLRIDRRLSSRVCAGNLLVLSSLSAVVVLSRDQRAAGDMEPDSVEIGRDGSGAGEVGNDDGAVEIISRRGLLVSVLFW